MIRTYRPGYRGVKAFFCLMGLLIVTLGIASLWEPLTLLIQGRNANAEIDAVVLRRPGEPDEIVTVKDEVKPDPTNTITFMYHAHYTTPDGVPAQGLLNLAFRAKSNREIADEMAVRYAPTQPERLVAIRDLATWTFGGFLVLCGLFLAFVQGIYFWHAGRPIAIPEDTPLEFPSS